MKKIIGIVVAILFLLFIGLVILIGQREQGIGFSLIVGASIGVFVALLSFLWVNKPIQSKKI